MIEVVEVKEPKYASVFKRTIYLSGTIAGISCEQATGWRDSIKKNYPEYKYKDPCKRYYPEDFPDVKEIVHLDKVEIEHSDYVLVNLTEYSAGTVMEIMHAFNQNKLVVIVNNMRKLDNHLSPWVLYHSSVVKPTFHEAMEYIREWEERN